MCVCVCVTSSGLNLWYEAQNTGHFIKPTDKENKLCNWPLNSLPLSFSVAFLCFKGRPAASSNRQASNFLRMQTPHPPSTGNSFSPQLLLWCSVNTAVLALPSTRHSHYISPRLSPHCCLSVTFPLLFFFTFLSMIPLFHSQFTLSSHMERRDKTAGHSRRFSRCLLRGPNSKLVLIYTYSKKI